MKRFGDISVAILVLVIVLMIILPVPKPLLDLFLALNISLAMLVLLISMFITEPLQFSVFPTILLITTLFRLALNISTTRYILIEGDAGSIIRTFGDFVIQGQAVVGIIIFAIIVLVQFLVITKGSERVSEVAARFTLDAMPGKQMAIDADLNAGLISDVEAKERRLKVQRESDFYGAMDGASKFVKGDAIAGIIITVINILAGFLIGSFMNGMDIMEALNKYTLLTVGDGLVSQIPALMISTGTGIVVTRAASDSSMGSDVLSQLFREPKVLYLLGSVLTLLGVVTPLPIGPFSILGITFIVLGFLVNRERLPLGETGGEEEGEAEVADAEEMRKPENIIPLLSVDPIELEFGYGIIPLADPNQGGDLFDRLVMIRRQIAMELGVVVPVIRLRDNIQLESSAYMIKVKGNEVSNGNIVFDHYMAMNPGVVEGEIDGIDTIEPAFGLPAKWIKADDREKAEVFGYTVVDPSSVISTHLTEIIKRHTHELLNREEVKSLVENVRENNSAVVEELIPSLMSIGDLQKVLCNLLREGVSVRDLASILETLADYATTTKDVNILTEYVRQGLSRTISGMYFPEGYARVVTLSQDVENMLMEAIGQNDVGSYLNIDPAITQAIINSTAQVLQELVAVGEQPIVVTAPIVRFYFKKMSEQFVPDLIVLSYNEIEASVEVQSAGMVTL